MRYSKNMTISFKITTITQLCVMSTTDDLRVHLSRWSSIRRRLLADRRLRTDLPSIWNALDAARCRLSDLGRSAIKWTRQLILVGFRVLAHGDLDRMGQDTLWHVARGLEQFNWVAASPLQQDFRFDERLSSWRRLSTCRRDVVTLSTVLQLVAGERAKYAAASALEHFANNPEFLHPVLGHGPRIPSPSWLRVAAGNFGTSSLVPDDGTLRTSTVVPDGVAVLAGNFGTSALVPDRGSVGTSSVIPDVVTVPDVAGRPSPLVDFSRRETTFAARFLQIVCHSTNLIAATEAQIREVRPHAAASSGDVRHLAVGGGRRKAVSWGDGPLSVAVSAAVRRYADDIWRQFSRHLSKFFVNVEWRETRRESRGRLGSIVICPHTATLLLQNAIRQAASDGTQSLYFISL